MRRRGRRGRMDKDDAFLLQVAQEIEFIAAIRQGVAELDRGDSVAIEAVEAEMVSWIIR